MPAIHDELREHLKLRYMADCKCGHCSIVPDELVRKAADYSEAMLNSLKALAADAKWQNAPHELLTIARAIIRDVEAA